MTSRGQRLLTRHKSQWLSRDDGDEAKQSQRGKPQAAPAGDPGLSDLQLEVALYIESISAELRQMARSADLEALSYFLEMARIEASIQIERRALSMPE